MWCAGRGKYTPTASQCSTAESVGKMSGKIEVTIVCPTYNHGQYIADALAGFEMQVTNFAFEVIIHDDASTDETPNVIRDFAVQSDLPVTVIEQTENIYSRGISYIDYVLPLIKGKYVAICEGDDYWTDSKKLQVQYDYLETHPDCSSVTHAAKIFDMAKGKINGVIASSDHEEDYSVERVIKAGGGLYSPCTCFFKKKLFDLPAEFRDWGIGDYPRAIRCAEDGPIHFLPQAMAVYRYGVPGSWTNRIKNREQAMRELNIRIEKLRELNRLRNHRYEDEITYSISKTSFLRNVEVGDWKEATTKLGRLYYEDIPPVQKVKFWAKARFPQAYEMIKRLK